MQNYTNDIMMIKCELMTFQDYLEMYKEIVFKENIGYEVDYEELKSKLESSKERFQNIFELLEEIDSKMRKLEWRVENE